MCVGTLKKKMCVYGGGGGGDVEVFYEVALIVAGTVVHSQYWHLRIVTKGSGKRKMFHGSHRVS